MKDNAASAVKITYYSSCLDNGTPRPASICRGLKKGNTVDFTAEIVVTSCPKDPKDRFQTIQISPVGVNESLIIDLELLCSCPCEQPGGPSFEINSPKCKGRGTYACGMCECNDPYIGKNCECSG